MRSVLNGVLFWAIFICPLFCGADVVEHLKRPEPLGPSHHSRIVGRPDGGLPAGPCQQEAGDGCICQGVLLADGDCDLFGLDPLLSDGLDHLGPTAIRIDRAELPLGIFEQLKTHSRQVVDRSGQVLRASSRIRI